MPNRSYYQARKRLALRKRRALYKKRNYRKRRYAPRPGGINGRPGRHMPGASSGLNTFGDGINVVYKYAMKALNIAKGVKNLINVEFKCLTANPFTTTSISIPATPANALVYYPPANIYLGDTSSDRNGQSILAKTLKFTAVLNANAAGSGVQRVRVLCVNYPVSEGQSIDPTELWDDSAVYNANRNLAYTKSFNVVYNREFTLDKVNRPSIRLAFGRKLNYHVKYLPGEGEGTPGDITSGLCALMVFSDQSSNAPTITYTQLRYYYIDN